MSLFDTYVLTTTRGESSARFVLVNIPVYHDTCEAYQTTAQRTLAHGCILFQKFRYFHIFFFIIFVPFAHLSDHSEYLCDFYFFWGSSPTSHLSSNTYSYATHCILKGCLTLLRPLARGARSSNISKSGGFHGFE